MKILAGIRASHGHHDEFAVVEQELVSHGRFERVTVLIDPFAQIEGGRWTHDGIIAVPGP
jgi:hypothetical protein